MLCNAVAYEEMPHLFVVLDDFSIMLMNNDIKVPLMGVLQIGRAAGIHIALVTSSISSRGFQKEIMSSVTCRVSFCVTTKTESKITIGQTGAENISVPGELIFKWQNKLVKCQGVYLPDKDIQKLIEKTQRENRKNVDIPESTTTQVLNSDVIEQSESIDEDEFFDVAVDAVLENGEASIEYVQRRLGLGFNRVSGLFDMMEKQGIVGPENDTSSRRILISKDQWQRIKNKNNTNIGYIELKTDEEQEQDIVLRDFAQFNIGNIGLGISDNHIQVSNTAITNYGSEICTPLFNGNGVTGLTYKKPRMFSRGYIEFVLKPDVKTVTSPPHIMTITKDDPVDIVHIEFDKKANHIIKTFMTQISQDIGVQLIEL